MDWSHGPLLLRWEFGVMDSWPDPDSPRVKEALLASKGLLAGEELKKKRNNKDCPKSESCKPESCKPPLRVEKSDVLYIFKSLFFCSYHFFILYPNSFRLTVLWNSPSGYYIPSSWVAPHLNFTIIPWNVVLFSSISGWVKEGQRTKDLD